MKISKDKMYMTRDGRKVRIYATDGGGKYPVHGAILYGKHWESDTWDPNGKYHHDWTSESSFDLIEVTPKRQSKPKKPTKKPTKKAVKR